MSSVTLFAWFHLDTRLLTAAGEVPAYAVAPGDRLVTIRKNGPPIAKVARIARRRVDFGRHPSPELARPIRVLAGAFAHGMPARNLLLAPNHAIYADGALLAVQALCNGTTIYQDFAPVSYVGVMLEAHDVVLAEGLAVASSLEGSQNIVPLHPRFGRVDPLGLCLPLLHDGRLVTEMRRVLAYRAGLERATKISPQKPALPAGE
jgi:hypothetical protein